MIGEPPLLVIAGPHVRPDETILAPFRDTPTSFIADAMGGRAALDWRIKPAGGIAAFVGAALTCDCGPADNLALCAAVAQCRPGDVLVAATDGYTSTAVVGDLLLGIAKNRGAAAFVTDGLVRDQTDIEALDFACFAMGTTPNSPTRNGPGSVGLPVQCGGVRIASGDLVIGDRDGVVVVPRERIGEIVASLAAIREVEERLLAKVRGGLQQVEFLTELLAGDRIHRVQS